MDEEMERKKGTNQADLSLSFSPALSLSLSYAAIQAKRDETLSRSLSLSLPLPPSALQDFALAIGSAKSQLIALFLFPLSLPRLFIKCASHKCHDGGWFIECFLPGAAKSA